MRADEEGGSRCTATVASYVAETAAEGCLLHSVRGTTPHRAWMAAVSFVRISSKSVYGNGP
jgi:hypothetical protein